MLNGTSTYLRHWGEVDLTDFDKAPAEIQAGMLAHIFEERISTPRGYSDPSNRTENAYIVAHSRALISEASVVSNMRGKEFMPVQESSAKPITKNVNGKIRVIGAKRIWKYGKLKYEVTMGVTFKRDPGNNKNLATERRGDIRSIKKIDNE